MKLITEPFYSKFYLQEGVVSLFYSSHITPMHRHNALQLVYDLKNDFLFRTENTGWEKHKCLIIKEGINHQLATNNSLQLILYLDKSEPIAKNISKKYLLNNDFYEPNISLSLSEEILLLQNLINPGTVLYCNFIESLLPRLADGKEILVKDYRMKEVLQLVREIPADDLSIEYLANKIYMSPSRLRAVFKNCTGFPLHQYILHHKILTAITEMANGHTIQDAAYFAGFKDSSHFNKMLKKIFKINPSRFLKENFYHTKENKSKFIFKTELAVN